MARQDRKFAVETEYGAFPAVITHPALLKLNDDVEMLNWGKLVSHHRQLIHEAALRKYGASGLDPRGKIVVDAEDIWTEPSAEG